MTESKNLGATWSEDEPGDEAPPGTPDNPRVIEVSGTARRVGTFDWDSLDLAATTPVVAQVSAPAYQAPIRGAIVVDTNTPVTVWVRLPSGGLVEFRDDMPITVSTGGDLPNSHPSIPDVILRDLALWGWEVTLDAFSGPTTDPGVTAAVLVASVRGIGQDPSNDIRMVPLTQQYSQTDPTDDGSETDPQPDQFDPDNMVDELLTQEAESLP
jgi:hypothetical protein